MLPADTSRGGAVAHGGAVRVALVALFCAALGVGFSPIFVRLSELAPSATGFHRVFLALPALWLWSAVEGRRRPARRRPASLAEHAWLAFAGVLFAGDLGFWHWSLQFTSVANSTLLANLAPIVVTIGAFVLFGERVSRTFLLGLVLAIAGAFVLMGESLGLSPTTLLGDALGLVTALFLGSYILLVSRLRARFSAASIMLWSTAATAMVLGPVALASGESLMATSLWGWAVLLGLALVVHAGAQGLLAYALAHLPAAFSAVALLFEPVAAAGLAWVLLGESLSRWQMAGAGAVLAGIVLARRGSR
jgi:drug/metabolite transporter (DMT)-like permease